MNNPAGIISQHRECVNSQAGHLPVRGSARRARQEHLSSTARSDDETPIELAIYEHKAALLGRSPSEVAQDADLLAKAVEREWTLYGADILTVGLDLYNVEAEACGAEVNWVTGSACPEIAGPLYGLEALPVALDHPDVTQDGRFPLMIRAGQLAQEALGSHARTRVGMSGPMSIASKLVPLSELLIGLISDPRSVGRLLSYCTEVAAAWAQQIARSGLEAIVFDSAASPPLVSPAQYREIVQPHHHALMSVLRDAGQRERPTIMGGDTSPIIADVVRAGANSVICDFSADWGAFLEAVQPFPDLIVRRNANPSDLLADEGRARQAARQVKRDIAALRHPVAGTGILAYDTPPENVLAFVDEMRTEVE